jgi:hypothetical protein
MDMAMRDEIPALQGKDRLELAVDADFQNSTNAVIVHRSA